MIVLLLSAFAISQQITSASASTGVIVPLYIYPGSTWDSLVQAKNAHPAVPIIAIINPNSGPGRSQDPNYVTGTQTLQSSGVTVIGYVYTSYGARSSKLVTADIDKYKNWYSVNGIFFDEMSNTSGKEDYYKNLSNYAESNGLTVTVGNPGTDTLPSYIGTVDSLVTYENAGLPSIISLQGWHTNYDKANFSILPYAVSTLDQTFVSSASNHVGYMYITNDNLPNPWDTLPPYFGDLVASLDTGSPPAPTEICDDGIDNDGDGLIDSADSDCLPPPQVSLTINSVNLSGTPISGLWTEISTGGSIIATGYTPFSYTANLGTEYTVCMANYRYYIFNQWDDGSTNNCRTITSTQDTILIAYYKVQGH